MIGKYAFLVTFLIPGLCSFDLTKNLRYFETIHKSQLGHTIVKRGATVSTHKFNTIKEVEFKALGKDFKLILSPTKGLLSSKFRAVEVDDEDDKEVFIPIDKDSFYEGRVFGEDDSKAQVHMEDGVITATIKTKEDLFHIEPAWRHLAESDQETMIAYKESDIKFSWTEPDENKNIPPKVCDYIKENGTVEDDGDDDMEVADVSGGRHKRSSEFNFNPGEGNLRQTRCPLLLVADYRFYKEMGGSNSKTTVNYLISLIDRVHKIYEDTVWRDTMDSGGFSGMGFIIKKIVVHRKPTTVREGEVHYNMFRSSWDVRNLLEVFSREYTHKDFCLAHLFTDIKFEGGILGLAYVGSPRRNSVGGICTPEYFKNGYTLYLNSGLSSSRNHYGQRVITREADLVTAHEFGESEIKHSWSIIMSQVTIGGASMTRTFLSAARAPARVALTSCTPTACPATTSTTRSSRPAPSGSSARCCWPSRPGASRSPRSHSAATSGSRATRSATPGCLALRTGTRAATRTAS